MSNITYSTKITGDLVTAADMNEIKTAVNSKQDAEGGKGLSQENFTTAEKTKLSGVATGATANSSDAALLNRTNHTGTQAATTITEDSTHRFATDAEKTAWNAKQAALTLTTTGSSGAATLIGGTLNIPQYSGGGGGTVDSTIIDGSANAVAGNAVFDALATKADLASPALTGNPTAPTQALGNNTTRVATTAFVQQEIGNNAIYFDNTQFSGAGSSGDPITIIGGGGGGGSQYERLNQGSFSNNASVLISFDAYKTTHKAFKLILISLKAQTSTASLKIRFSANGTTALSGNNYSAVRGETTIFTNPQGTTTEAPSTEFTVYPNMDVAAGKYVEAEYNFNDINNAAKFPKIHGYTTGWAQGVGPGRHEITAHYEVASTFLGIQLYCSSGNIVSGEWMLMGLQN